MTAATASARRRKLWLTFATLCAGCYAPQPLDARAVYEELRAERAPLQASTGSATPAPDAPLSEPQAIALALVGNPDLRALRRQKGLAEGQVTTARALENPTLQIELLHLEDYGLRQAYALSLGWTPPQPGVYGAGIAAAKALRRAVDSDVAEAEWQLMTSVRQAHAALLAQTQARALLDDAIARRGHIRDLVQKRLTLGASTKMDLSLAELNLSELERQRDSVVTQEVAAAQQLAQLLGATATVRAGGAIPEDASAPPGVEPLMTSALEHRPALRAEQQRFAAREQTIRQEKARAYPWFSISSGPRYRSDASEYNAQDFSVVFKVTLPVFYQNQGAIAVATAQRDQEREQFRKLVQGLRLQIVAARQSLTTQQQTLLRYHQSVLPSLDAREQLLTQAAQGGALDLVALLTAEDIILRSRRELVTFALGQYQAWLQLDAAVGAPVGPTRAQPAP